MSKIMHRWEAPDHFGMIADDDGRWVLHSEAQAAIEAADDSITHWRVSYERARAENARLAKRVEELDAALETLLSSVDAYNEANGRVMVDPHSTESARAMLAAAEDKGEMG